MEKKERKNVQREQDNLERKKRKVCKNIDGQILGWFGSVQTN